MWCFPSEGAYPTICLEGVNFTTCELHFREAGGDELFQRGKCGPGRIYEERFLRLDNPEEVSSTSQKHATERPVPEHPRTIGLAEALGIDGFYPLVHVDPAFLPESEP